MQCFCKFTDFRLPQLYRPSAIFTQLVLSLLSVNCSSLQSSLLSTSLLLFNQSTTKCLMKFGNVPDAMWAPPGRCKPRVGCTCTDAWLPFCFHLPHGEHAWLIYCLVSIFGQVVFKELQDDKSFNNLERG